MKPEYPLSPAKISEESTDVKKKKKKKKSDSKKANLAYGLPGMRVFVFLPAEQMGR